MRRPIPPASDAFFMNETIRLARRGIGSTHPNPAVGCLIVHQGKIIGRGWHRKAGGPHAEIAALQSLARPGSARGAVFYVTLEPCSSHGRTPPCTEALISAGAARVVVGAIDPDPRHRGRGLKILRTAGIKVTRGVLEDECVGLNPEFHHAMSTGLPWVIAKCGMSLDGRLTRPPGEPRWITSPAARADAMRLRARVDAILVGAGTVRADNPALTLRGVRGAPQPWRAVWAPRGQPPHDAQVLHDRWKDRTLILRDRSLRGALRSLAARGVRSVLIEGGGHTLGRVMDERLACEVVFYVAPMLAGGKVPAIGGRGAGRTCDAVKLDQVEYRTIGACLRMSGLIRRER